MVTTQYLQKRPALPKASLPCLICSYHRQGSRGQERQSSELARGRERGRDGREVYRPRREILTSTEDQILRRLDGWGGGDVGDVDAQSVFINGDNNRRRDAVYVCLQARFDRRLERNITHQFVRVSETLTPDDVMVNTVNKTQCFLLSIWPISGL
jgi:hypothetical protein